MCHPADGRADFPVHDIRMQVDGTKVEAGRAAARSAAVDPTAVEGLKSVVVVGGDAVVGQALELLLDSEDRRVSFLREDFREEDFREEPRVLEGVELLVFTPGLSTERRRRILALIEDAPSAQRIPVLEFVANARASPAKSGRFVAPWPCRTEELNRHVEAAFSFRAARA